MCIEKIFPPLENKGMRGHVKILKMNHRILIRLYLSDTQSVTVGVTFKIKYTSTMV